jgi:prophage regulatory protein
MKSTTQTIEPTSGERILRLPEVEQKTGLKHSAIFDRMEKGEFPHSFSIIGTKAKGWLLSEIDEWIRQRAATRKAKGAVS